MTWEADGLGFKTRFANHEFVVWNWTDRDDEISGYTLQLKNQKNLVLDSIVASEYSPNHEFLGKIFNGARRIAYKVEDVISDLELALMQS